MFLTLTRRFTVGIALACCLVANVGTTCGQTSEAASIGSAVSPAIAERALSDTERATSTELRDLEFRWREVFREARSPRRLRGFVGETLGLVEKLKQVQERVFQPAATDERIKGLFRARILDENSVCDQMEKSIRDFCRKLDDQDQALLIKLKIDRAATRTTLSPSVIDVASFKRPIHAAASAAVDAVKNDMARFVASFAASEAIGMAAKRAARDRGLMPGKEGSFADFLGGLLIETAVGAAVDAIADPTDDMVRALDGQLMRAERAILEGTANAPGFVTTLRRVASERAEARRKLVQVEISK